MNINCITFITQPPCEKRWTGLLANTDDDIGELEESTKALTERQHQTSGKLKEKSTKAIEK